MAVQSFPAAARKVPSPLCIRQNGTQSRTIKKRCSFGSSAFSFWISRSGQRPAEPGSPPQDCCSHGSDRKGPDANSWDEYPSVARKGQHPVDRCDQAIQRTAGGHDAAEASGIYRGGGVPTQNGGMISRNDCSQCWEAREACCICGCRL